MDEIIKEAPLIMVYGFHCDFFIILTLCSGKGTRFSINKRLESHLSPRAEGSFDSNVFIVQPPNNICNISSIPNI